MAWMFEINGAFPTPLVLAAKLPSASLETGLARQPAEAKARLFLPTSTRLQLAFVETERLAAEHHVKSKVVLEKGLEMGMKPLSKMPKGELVALLKECSLDSNGRKDALVQRLMECAASGDEASDGSLAHLAQLESALRAVPAKWKSALSVGGRWLRRDARRRWKGVEGEVLPLVLSLAPCGGAGCCPWPPLPWRWGRSGTIAGP